MHKRNSTICAVSLAAALLAGCGGGGGGGSHSIPPVVQPGNGQKVQTAIVVSVPGRNGTSVLAKTGRIATTGGTRQPMITFTGYSSRATKSIGVSVVATGAGLPLNGSPQFATNISPSFNSNNTTCTIAATDGSYSCTVLIAAPVGFDDFQISEWDANNTTPGFAPPAMSGNVLAIGTLLNSPVEQNQVNSLNIKMNGVVNSGKITLTTTTMVSGTANSTVVGVDGLDADGNIITGTLPWVDASNTAVKLQVAGTINAVTGFTAAPSSDFSGLLFNNYTAPGLTNTIVYTPTSGNPLASITFALTASAGTVAAGNLHGSVLSFTTSNGTVAVPGAPQATAPCSQFGTPCLYDNNPFDMIAGSDGNIYVNDDGGIGGIFGGWMDQVTTSGSVNSFELQNASNNNPAITWIASGADGDIWYADSVDNIIGKFAPSAVPAGGTLSIPLANETTALPGTPWGLIAGADGKMYATDGLASGNIDIVTPQTMNVQTISVLANPYGIAKGPVIGGDNTVVWSERSRRSLGILDLTTHVVTHLSFNLFSATPQRLVKGSDNLMYVGLGTAEIDSVDLTGTGAIVHRYALASGGLPEDIEVGPDGNIWAGESNGNDTLARITIEGGTNLGVVQEYGATANLPTLCGPTTGIVAGPDHNLWSDDLCGNAIKLVLP